jgi:RimJ/RimL family protein N-acetyltransferase
LLAESATHPDAQQDGWSTTVEGLNSMFPGVIWIVAEAEDDVVAVTTLAPQHAGDWVLFYTGVAPAHRGRGLARGVKQLLHQVAAQRGAPAVTTTNEITNISIRRLNESLGYRRVRGEIRLQRPGGTGPVATGDLLAGGKP